MIPLRDTVRSTNTPYVNISLIVLNTLVFLYQRTLGPVEFQQFIERWGATPRVIIDCFSQGIFLIPVITVFTAAFLHGGWIHIISNMLFLWVFGDNVEEYLGHGMYLVFYLFMAFVANMTQVVMDADSIYPLIGASGAVAGILGAYYRLYPKAKVLTLVPIFFIITFMEIKASIFIVIWFALQVINGYFSIVSGTSNVGWWAHLGGFLFGLFFILRFVKKKQRQPL